MISNVSYKPVGIDQTRAKPEVTEAQKNEENKRVEEKETNKTEELRVSNKVTANSLGRYIDVRA